MFPAKEEEEEDLNDREVDEEDDEGKTGKNLIRLVQGLYFHFQYDALALNTSRYRHRYDISTLPIYFHYLFGCVECFSKATFSDITQTENNTNSKWTDFNPTFVYWLISDRYTISILDLDSLDCYITCQHLENRCTSSLYCARFQ